MLKSHKRGDGRSLRIKIATNVVLSVLVFSIGALCLSANTDKNITVDGGETDVYRSAPESSAIGVSLMFNVYWGTDEVYRILDILSAHNAKATFFIGGCWADDNVECLKTIYSHGHELGNHGYFHKDHAKLNAEQNTREIADCNRFIQLATGYAPTLFAPPSGSYGNVMLTVCNTLNMKTVLWSKDTIDWRDKNAALIYTRATKNVKKGDFILMHPMQATADALEDILQYYQSVSLPVVTVSENLQEKG